LAPQNPSMHWGWAAGYRFIALEGMAGGPGNLNNVFEIHALNDGNYKTLTLPTAAELTGSTLTIHLTADYKALLTGVNVGGGIISHGSGGASATVMNNLKNLVFTSQTSRVVDPAFAGTFRISPNQGPAGNMRVTTDLPAGPSYRIACTDMTGRQVMEQTLPSGIASVGLDHSLRAGLYLVQLWQNDRVVAVEKVVVTE
jgi:hypothetical protein